MEDLQDPEIVGPLVHVSTICLAISYWNIALKIKASKMGIVCIYIYIHMYDRYL